MIQVYYRNPAGTVLQKIITNYSRLEYARAENKVGYLYLDLDPASFDAGLLQVNARLEPWRSVGANTPYLDGETVFFLREWSYSIGDDGSEVLSLSCQDAVYLLDSRIVAYAAGSAQAAQTSAIDNMLKQIVDDNFGPSATDTLRNTAVATGMQIQANASLAPSTTKEFARRSVLAVLQDLIADSAALGTYLVFDIVYITPEIIEFRTYVGQRGSNHGKGSPAQVVISRERKNLEAPKLTESHMDERNFIYAGGQETGGVRVIKTSSTADAIGINRRELWVDSRQASADAAVQADADAAIAQNQARLSLSGRIVDTDGCMDGIHYRYGDIVYAEYRGRGFDAHYNAMHVTVEGGAEVRDCRISSGRSLTEFDRLLRDVERLKTTE